MLVGFCGQMQWHTARHATQGATFAVEQLHKDNSTMEAVKFLLAPWLKDMTVDEMEPQLWRAFYVPLRWRAEYLQLQGTPACEWAQADLGAATERTWTFVRRHLDTFVNEEGSTALALHRFAKSGRLAKVIMNRGVYNPGWACDVQVFGARVPERSATTALRACIRPAAGCSGCSARSGRAATKCAGRRARR